MDTGVDEVVPCAASSQGCASENLVGIPVSAPMGAMKRKSTRRSVLGSDKR